MHDGRSGPAGTLSALSALRDDSLVVRRPPAAAVADRDDPDLVDDVISAVAASDRLVNRISAWRDVLVAEAFRSGAAIRRAELPVSLSDTVAWEWARTDRLKHLAHWRVTHGRGGELVWQTPAGRRYRDEPVVRLDAGPPPSTSPPPRADPLSRPSPTSPSSATSSPSRRPSPPDALIAPGAAVMVYSVAPPF